MVDAVERLAFRLALWAAGTAIRLAQTAAALWLSWFSRSPIVAGFGTGALVVWILVGWFAALLVAAAGCVVWHRANEGGAMRRRFKTARDHCGLREFVGVGPVRAVPYGYTVEIQVQGGKSVRDVAARREALAASLRAMRLIIEPNPRNAAHATVKVIERDILPEGPMPWPGATSAWDPIPIGRYTEDGEVAYVKLWDDDLGANSQLNSGVPGSGKTSCLQMIVATAAADPDADLFILDAKGVDFGAWINCCTDARTDTAGAVEVLETLRDEMHRRKVELAEVGRHKIERGLQRLIVLVVDECQEFIRESPECYELLRTLVAQSRAYGIAVILSTQRPSSNLLPTDLRDNVSTRVAFRCKTPESSDMILGAGMAAAGYNAAEITRAERGVCLLSSETDSGAQRVRTFFITPDEIRERAGSHERA